MHRVGASKGKQCTEWRLVRGGSAQLVGASAQNENPTIPS